MQNQLSEEKNVTVYTIDEEIRKSARDMRNQDGYPIGCMVENMIPYILSDICLILNESLIPSIKECHHSGRKRFVFEFL